MSRYMDNEMKVGKDVARSIFEKIGGINQLDYDDLYSIAAYALWRCVEQYDESKCDNFHAFYCIALKKKFASWNRDRYSKTRHPDAGLSQDERDEKMWRVGSTFVPLDSDEVGKDKNLAHCFQASYCLEDEVIDDSESNEKIDNFISRLSRTQKKIVNLIMDGFKPEQIQSELGISCKDYNEHMRIIRLHENVKYLY